MGRLFLAFVGGLALAAGVSWYLHSKPAPPVQASAPAPVVNEPVPEPVVEEKQPEPAPPRVVSRPVAVKPAIVAAVVKEVKEPVREPDPEPPARPAPIPAPPVAETPTYSLPLPAQNVEVHAPTSASAPVARPEPAKPEVPRTPRTVTLPAGTLITVRLNETLDSGRNEQDYNFRATLDAPVIVDNLVLAERGTLQGGRIVGVDKAGRVRGAAKLELILTRLTTSDGQTVDIDTDTFTKKSEHATEGRQAARRAGMGAMIGAAIGGMAGGGKGAIIGAGAGAGAGAGSVVLQKGSEAVLTNETRISFRLKNAVTITEKLPGK